MSKLSANQNKHLQVDHNIIKMPKNKIFGFYVRKPHKRDGDITFTNNDLLPDLEFTITPMDFLSRSNSRVAIRRSYSFHHWQQPLDHII